MRTDTFEGNGGVVFLGRHRLDEVVAWERITLGDQLLERFSRLSSRLWGVFWTRSFSIRPVIPDRSSTYIRGAILTL